MKFNFINNLSLFRAAVIQKFLFINLYPDVVKFILIKRKESFFKLTNVDAGKDYSIISSEYFDCKADYLLIKNKLNEFIKKNNLKDAPAFIGINVFKSSAVTLQADTDDIDLWFSENAAKFLPDGRPADEFGFSYEQINEDENHKYFNLAIVRHDYVNEIIKNFSIEGIRIYGIFPFHFSINSFDYQAEKKRLLLDYSSGKIIYTFLSRTSNFFSGEIFSKISVEDVVERELNREEIKASLIKIKQNVSSNFGNNSLSQLEVYLCCRKEDYEIIKSDVENIFNEVPISINNNLKPEEHLFLPSLFAYNKILKDNELKLNLLPPEFQVKEREFIEKQLSLKFILGIGGVLIFLLLFSNALNGFLRCSLEEAQSNALTVSSDAMKLSNLQKENQYLRANYKLLKKLKKHEKKYSTLLYNISRFIKDGSCLTGLNIKENENKSINIEIAGLAYEQQDIADIMKRMEDDKKFSDINLLYTSVIKPEELQLKGNIPHNKSLVQFNLSAKYYAD